MEMVKSLGMRLVDCPGVSHASHMQYHSLVDCQLRVKSDFILPADISMKSDKCLTGFSSSGSKSPRRISMPVQKKTVYAIMELVFHLIWVGHHRGIHTYGGKPASGFETGNCPYGNKRLLAVYCCKQAASVRLSCSS